MRQLPTLDPWPALLLPDRSIPCDEKYLWRWILSVEIAAVLEDQPSGRVVEPYWVGQSLIPRSEGRASETPPPSLVLNNA